MGGTGSFPIDLLLFGMVAAFLVLRLRGILGRKTGFERPAAPVAGKPGITPVIDAVAEPEAAPTRKLPAPGTLAADALVRIRQVEPAFDADRFLIGAEAAFRMIVKAYAAGDRVALHPLLSAETYASFESAIAAREQSGERQETEIRALLDVAVEEAMLQDHQARIVVRFVSDQVNQTLDRDGKYVSGSDAVTEITDLWTFERTLGDASPAWRLTATRSG